MRASPSTIARPEQSLLDLVIALKGEWREGATPNIRAAVSDHPSLLRHRSLLVDLAYEEYCLREARGMPIDVERFCSSVPAFRSQIRDAILGHRFLADHPELFFAPEPVWPVPGEQVEGISLIHELGRGTFARAYLGWDVEAGDRLVVLKMSPAPTTEARMLGKLQHPSIAGILWAKRDPGFFTICMPFVGATTLRDVIDVAFAPATEHRCGQTILGAIDRTTGELSVHSPEAEPAIRAGDRYPRAIAAIAAPLASGLAYLHQRGITHGDLKPSNVILGQGGKPYLIDFNLSHTSEAALLRCGGTFPYMAPEQIEWLLEPKLRPAPTSAADMYSFGVVLYEALAGSLPHEFVGDPDVQASIDRFRVSRSLGTPSVRIKNPEIPRQLAILVDSCLSADPTLRPTAARLHQELSHLLRPARGLRWLFVASVATLLLVAVWQNFRTTPPAGTAASPSAIVQEPTTAEALFDLGVSDLAAGNTTSALRHFEGSGRSKEDGRTLAFIGYIQSRSGHSKEAESYYRTALAEGYDKPWVHNYRANALSKLDSQPGPTLKMALEEATRARQDSADTRAIQLNWAWIRFLTKLDQKNNRLDDPECVQEMEKVLQIGPYDLDLYYKAAVIFAAASKDEPRLREKAFYCVREAIAFGKKPAQLKCDPVLRANLKLPGQSEFEEAILAPESPVQPLLNLQLVNPVE
jgi:eukaryotic-like serine/threonine-protein kinase